MYHGDAIRALEAIGFRHDRQNIYRRDDGAAATIQGKSYEVRVLVSPKDDGDIAAVVFLRTEGEIASFGRSK